MLQLLDDTTAKTFRQIADDIENEGVENYAELFKKKPKILERHFVNSIHSEPLARYFKAIVTEK